MKNQNQVWNIRKWQKIEYFIRPSFDKQQRSADDKLDTADSYTRTVIFLQG